ncbi:SusC/RagA family TonB-linked outer membrane protein [soil metagenome]
MSALISEVRAQERTVSGRVTSVEGGEGLPGVNVIVKGTTVGTTTDIDGNYNISVPEGATTLVFSFIGLTTQEMVIGNRSVVDVRMSPDVQQLSEVIVTAVGIERERRALGYSVENIKAEQIQQVSEPDALRALQGKVPGVNIIGSSGVPGSATRITIRGNSSFFGNNQPLFVVDGIPFDNSANTTSFQLTGGGAYGSRIADLDPNNIESMTVLKGAAAAALYGSRAANGVIVVTTKSGSGRAGRTGLEIAVNSSYSIENLANLPDYQNKYGAGTGFNYSNVNGSWGPAFPGTVNYPTSETIPHWYGVPAFAAAFPEFQGTTVPYRAYPDNVKDFFQTGNVFENSITVGGGNETANISAVVSKMGQEGFIPFSSFDRTTISLGANAVLGNGFTVGGNVSYITSVQEGPAGGASNAVGNASAFGRTMIMARNWDLHGQPFENPLDRSNVFFVGTGQSTNPLWSVRYDGFSSNVDRATANMNAGYDIFDWLSVSYKIGVNQYTQRNREWYRPGSRGADGLGQVINDDIRFQEIESNLLLTATRNLTDDISIRAILGHNVNQRTTDQQSVQGTEMVDFNIIDIDNTNSVIPNGGDYVRRRLFGIFGDVTLGYRDWAYLTLTGRNDWSSTLPVDNQSFFYPAVSASLIFTEALNMNSPVLTIGKLRASWSRVGNDANPYSLVPTFSINLSPGSNLQASLPDNDFPFRGVPGATLGNTVFDPNLTPEFTTEIELGTQLEFFNNRLGLDVTIYKRSTTDQIGLISIPVVTGFSAVFTNFGELENKGIELGINATPVALANGFNWSLYGTFTHNKNTVISLAPGVEEVTIRPLFGGGVTPVLRPGQEYGLLRGTRSARDDEENLLINPATGLLIPDPVPGIIGNPNPDFIVGLTNTFSFRGFTLSGVIDWRQGGDIYSVTTNSLLGRGVTKDTEDREVNKIIPGVLGDANTAEPIRDEGGNKIPNRRQVEENALWFGESFGINGADEWSVYDGTTIRLREISVGYRLPQALMDRTPFGSASISLTGRNLWYNAPNFPKHTNFDPETNTFGAANFQGLEFQNAPSVRRMGVNIRFTF